MARLSRCLSHRVSHRLSHRLLHRVLHICRRIALLCAATTAAAVIAASATAQPQQVFRYVDKEGRIVYTDRAPPSDSKDVQAKRLSPNFIENNDVPVAGDKTPASSNALNASAERTSAQM